MRARAVQCGRSVSESVSVGAQDDLLRTAPIKLGMLPKARSPPALRLKPSARSLSAPQGLWRRWGGPSAAGRDGWQGSMGVFDSRLLHCGGANRSPEGAIFYLTFKNARVSNAGNPGSISPELVAPTPATPRCPQLPLGPARA